MAKPSVEIGVSGIVLGGGIGAGKSQVAEFLAAHGAFVIDADRIGHRVLEPGGPSFDQVGARWPSVVVDGHVDRRLLAGIVFRDPDELTELEAITHPAIIAEIQKRVEEADGPVVIEAPVMLPLGDGLLRVFVDADESTRIDRAVARGGDAADVRRRIANQADRAAWLAWADAVIVNNGTQEDLAVQVDALWERLQVR